MTTDDAQLATEPGLPPGRPDGDSTSSFSLITTVLRLRELSVVVVVIVLLVYFSVSNSAFYSSNNLGNVANLTSAATFLAAGEVFLLVCGEIDLSAGMTFGLSPFIMMSVNDHGVPLLISFLIALLVCGVIGLFNGLVTQFLKLPSFITTLGTLYLLHGITLKVSHSFPRPAPTSGALVRVLGGAKWSEIVWAIVVVVVMQIVLNQTKWGTYTIATGANLLVGGGHQDPPDQGARLHPHGHLRRIRGHR
jgi:simple sugar transport system permease protein